MICVKIIQAINSGIAIKKCLATTSCLIRKASAILKRELLNAVSPNVIRQAITPNNSKTAPTFPNNPVEIILTTPDCPPDSVKAVF